ncbi:iron-siderophore ABC transporter substrate-binding protein [Paenibacillus sp. H1-7]|uniref:ABC transporter substrate-binding protein n=1 Tax=Paenibacillus sp. H1-7 TaxID=2282849 RepID=UPI001EF86D0D|nr:iron-siderophore ABC transporter substrate-binding protein [Paenibacillus sp. H1-7]ULL18629.1 iron-siderophore ABC transporter substrate-binding protein [Paenibacillus sp. H1-7]
MFRKTTFPVVAILLSLALILSACGSGGASNTVPVAGSEKTGGAAAAGAQNQQAKQPEASKPYTVKHAMGETTVKGDPKRVVVLGNDAVEAALALGIKPVGMVKAWGVQPMYDHLKDKLDGVQIVGDENQPNMEAIVALKPDLIIGIKLRQEKIYDQLSAIAPTIFSERTNSDSLINFKLYAEALNKKEEGDKKLAEFDKHVKELQQKLGDKVNTKVSLVRFYVADKVRVYYQDTFAGGILKKVGLKRPAAQDKETFADIISRERMPELDGDIMFYFTLEDEKGETTKNEKLWQEDPLWKNLDVVKKGKTIKVNDGIWNSSGGILSAHLLLDDLEKYLLK